MTIWLIDWKSSTGVWDDMRIQVSVYEGIWIVTGGTPKIEKVGILRLDKETGMLDDPPVVKIPVQERMNRWIAFLRLREYYRLIIQPTLSDKRMDRFYAYNGKKFPTVTTILDILNKPALVQWAANMTIEYIKDNMKEMIDEPSIEYHLKKAKTAFRTVSKKAMDTGSIVHDAIHAYLSGAKPESILEGNDRATNSFLAFLDWNKTAKLKPVALEKILIDPLNETGGTTDFIGEANI